MADAPQPSQEGMPFVPEGTRRAYAELMRRVSELARIATPDVRLVQEALSLAEMLLRIQERRLSLLEARIVYMEPVRADDPGRLASEQLFGQRRANLDAIDEDLRGFTGAGEVEQALLRILNHLSLLAEGAVTIGEMHEQRLRALEQLFGRPQR